MVYIIMKLINKTLINILIHKRQIPFPYYSRKSFRGYDYLFSPSVIQNITNVC